ncbi:MAG: hypothetical protein M0Z53_01155 [Thermaerobacter sp.]|nr:hypothetical protein [Thermaerobacter sp.]
MTQPLYWVPTLLLPAGQDGSWHAQRFLRWHGGRGHVVSGGPPPSGPGSRATLVPQSGQVWHAALEALAPDLDSGPVDLCLPCPPAPGTEIWQDLTRAVRRYPLRRLIVKRPAMTPLCQIDDALKGMTEAFAGAEIWLDWRTIGQEAIAYLAAKYPQVQLDNVPDDGLHQLISLAAALHRPLCLTDFSGRPPVELPAPAQPALPRIPVAPLHHAPVKHQWL